MCKQEVGDLVIYDLWPRVLEPVTESISHVGSPCSNVLSSWESTQYFLLHHTWMHAKRHQEEKKERNKRLDPLQFQQQIADQS